jgi:hypothetical protein
VGELDQELSVAFIHFCQEGLEPMQEARGLSAAAPIRSASVVRGNDKRCWGVLTFIENLVERKVEGTG